MVALLAVAVLALQTPQGPPPADRFADSATAALIRNARAARERNERLVTAYRATVTQRLGVGLRAISRDRMLYRQELVAKISWRRDAQSTLEWLGAREGVPVAERKDQLPDLFGEANSLIVDPAGDYVQVIAGGGEGFLYPLGDAAEREYRYARGDSLVISLPTGKQVRLIAVDVSPRRADFRLMVGTLWFDADSYNLVRIVFRPSRPFELRRDLDAADQKDVPGWVNATLEVKYVTLEYGLYNQRWWMPRYMAIDASGSSGGWLGVPFRMERTYGDYEVEGGTPPDPNSTFVPAGRRVRTMVDAGWNRDSARAAVRASRDTSGGRSRADTPRLRIIVPADTASLLTAPTLGEPILDMGDLISENELSRLAGPLGQLPGRPWDTHVEIPRSLSTLLKQARYNRIEALSLGTGVGATFGPFALRGGARFGLADQVVNGDATLLWRTAEAHVTVGGYRRLAAANPENRPLGLMNSLLALTAQRDDGEYFRATGAEVTITEADQGWYRLRFFSERQRTAEVETDAALPHLFSRNQRFRLNIEAERTSQRGASLALHGNRPLSRTVTLGADATLDASYGGYDFARGSLLTRLVFTPAGKMAGALTLGAGTSRGEVPTQSHYFVGGPGTLRGYDGGTAHGDAFWLFRAEVSNALPAARVVGFFDAGWAGSRHFFGQNFTLTTIGVGVSFADGLVRIDLARALKDPKKDWRLELYLDGIL